MTKSANPVIYTMVPFPVHGWIQVDRHARAGCESTSSAPGGWLRAVRPGPPANRLTEDVLYGRVLVPGTPRVPARPAVHPDKSDALPGDPRIDVGLVARRTVEALDRPVGVVETVDN